MRPELQAELLPTVISSNGIGSFEKMFEYTGTKDYTPHLSFTHALNFRAQFGEEQLQAYTRTLSIQGAKLLADAWKTQCIAPDEMTGFIAPPPSPCSSNPCPQVHVLPAAAHPLLRHCSRPVPASV